MIVIHDHFHRSRVRLIEFVTYVIYIASRIGKRGDEMRWIGRYVYGCIDILLEYMLLGNVGGW